MSPPDLMNVAGAVWCEQHGRYECSKRSKRSGGGQCHASPIRGTATCRTHAGKPTAVAKAEGEAITAWSALSGEASVGAAEAVLGMLQMSWLRVHLYAGLLERQVADGQGGGRGDVDEDGHEDPGARADVGAGAGLVGHTYSGVKDIGIFATGEAIRGLAQLEATERDRCVRFAKVAHDMGIADRQIRLAEEQGQLLAGVIGRVLDALGLTAEQRARVPEIVPRELRAVAAGGG